MARSQLAQLSLAAVITLLAVIVSLYARQRYRCALYGVVVTAAVAVAPVKTSRALDVWGMYTSKLGRQAAARHVPECFRVNTDDMRMLQQDKLPAMYLLRTDTDDMRDAYVAARGLDEVLQALEFNEVSSRNFPETPSNFRYTVVQRVLTDRMLIGRRAFGVRVFMLVSGSPRTASVHENGVVFWARRRYNPDALEGDMVLASHAGMVRERTPAEVSRVYAGHPQTLPALLQYLAFTGESLAARHSIDAALRKLCEVAMGRPELQQVPQLYAVDLALDSAGAAWVLRMRSVRGPQAASPLEADIRKDILRDAGELQTPGFRRV